MNFQIHHSIMAAIPILDLPGKEFLTFYTIAFIVAWGVSLLLKAGTMKKFSSRSTDTEPLTDPYELAFLAGGAARCGQLATTRLLRMNAIKWDHTAFPSGRFTAHDVGLQGMNEIEMRLHDRIQALGSEGMSAEEVVQTINPYLNGIEAKLAIKGLRPTRAEHSSFGYSMIWPLLLLAMVGGVKILIGLERGKPVLFLVLAVAITAFLAWRVGSSKKVLTPAGERLVKTHRSRFEAADSNYAPDFFALSMGMALMGPDSFSLFAGNEEIDPTLQQGLLQMQPKENVNDGSFSGFDGGGSSFSSDSGGGDSGGSSCGGSGCGGCGGGGD